MFLRGSGCTALWWMILLPAAAPMVLADAPQTYLALEDDTLQVIAGKPVRMRLQIPGGESWAEANVGQLQVRTFGEVASIVPDPAQNGAEPTYAFKEPGYAMVLLAAGPATARGLTDSVSRTPYCAKLLIRVEPAGAAEGAGLRPVRSAGMTAKAGLKCEVCPYIDPLSLQPQQLAAGADLPVRVYFEGASQANATVTAYGPGDVRQTRVTDAKGIARFKLHAAGRWVIRYEHVADGSTYTGDLVFDAGAGRQEGGR